MYSPVTHFNAKRYQRFTEAYLWWIAAELSTVQLCESALFDNSRFKGRMIHFYFQFEIQEYTDLVQGALYYISMQCNAMQCSQSINVYIL